MDTNATPVGAHHKMFWAIVILCILAVAAMVIIAAMAWGNKPQVAGQANSANTAQGLANNTPAQPTYKELDPSATPDFFPKDLPTEANAKVLKTYNNSTGDGRKMGTKIYATAKSQDDNISTYKSYFQNNGWTVVDIPPIKGDNTKTILATKGNMQAQVSAGQNAVYNTNAVTVTITQTPTTAPAQNAPSAQ